MLNRIPSEHARVVIIFLGALAGGAAHSHGQGCEAAREYAAAARAHGAGTAEDPAFVSQWLPRVLAAIDDGSCAADRKSLRGDATAMAMGTRDWEVAARLCRAALDDPATDGDDTPSGREDRCLWLWNAAGVSLARAQDGQPDRVADAARAVDSFVSFAGTIDPRTGGADGAKWLRPVAQSLAMKADLLRKTGDAAGAADAERQGSLFVASFALDRESLRRLGGLAPDEFLQRAAVDMLRAGRTPQAVGVLASINLLAFGTRPASAHAQVVLREAARLERVPEFARDVLDVLPRDGEMVLFCKDAALLMWPAHNAEAAALIDRVLASPGRVFAEAASLRPPAAEGSPRATPPIDAELRVHRAMLAAKLGDFTTADRLIERVRSDGNLGDWSRGPLSVIEMERKRVR
jgi:hypothetical protein